MTEPFRPTPLGWFAPPPPPPPPPPAEVYPEVKAYPGLTPDSRVCNCARCGRLLAARDGWRAGLPDVFGWREEPDWGGHLRPYCELCHPVAACAVRPPWYSGGRRVVRKAVDGDDDNPWRGLAVRLGEDSDPAGESA